MFRATTSGLIPTPSRARWRPLVSRSHNATANIPSRRSKTCNPRQDIQKAGFPCRKPFENGSHIHARVLVAIHGNCRFRHYTKSQSARLGRAWVGARLVISRVLLDVGDPRRSGLRARNPLHQGLDEQDVPSSWQPWRCQLARRRVGGILLFRTSFGVTYLSMICLSCAASIPSRTLRIDINIKPIPNMNALNRFSSADLKKENIDAITNRIDISMKNFKGL